jgi:hypothetical protein
VPDSLALKLQGRMLIVVDLEDVGPMEWRVEEDPQLVADVLRLLVDRMGPTMSVDSYKAAYGRKLKRLLDGAK